MINTQSTVTLQQIVDIGFLMADIQDQLNVAWSPQGLLALTIANDVMNAICAVPFPWKWNEMLLPFFYTNILQQDYALVTPTNDSITNIAWLERGIAIDINNNAEPKDFRTVEVGRQLPQQTGTWYTNGFSNTGNPLFLANFFPNNMLYYGSWGSANTGNSTLGNNPVAGSIYINPLNSAQSMPQNPIQQIQDANGNLLVLTTYGTEGSTAPLAASNALPGTQVSGSGATTVWTVVDPSGQGIRIVPAPAGGGTVWQMSLVAQMKPARFKNLGQTLFPLPDDMEPHFRQGFIAQCYRYSQHKDIRAKFKDEWQEWQLSLLSMRSKEDRETEENMFVPDRGIMGGSVGRSRFLGPAYPFNYPTS